MRSNYTSIRAMFYGPYRGCSYDCVRACRDPTYVPLAMRFFPLPSQGVAFPMELEKSSQLGAKTRYTNTNSMQTTLSSEQVALHGEMGSPQPFSHGPLIQLYDDAYLKSIPTNKVSSYARMCHDVIHDTWRLHGLHDTHQVHIYVNFDSYHQIICYLC